LIARYSGIFFGMLTLALSMVCTARWSNRPRSAAPMASSRAAEPVRHDLHDPREADFMLYAVSVVTTGSRHRPATILFRSSSGSPASPFVK